MHTNWCVLIDMSMEIGMLNFWLPLLVTAQTKENYFTELHCFGFDLLKLINHSTLNCRLPTDSRSNNCCHTSHFTSNFIFKFPLLIKKEILLCLIKIFNRSICSQSSQEKIFVSVKKNFFSISPVKKVVLSNIFQY